MKITIFGANGAIGKIVTSYAIRNGDIVTAYVRNSESLVKTKNLNIVVGNFSNQLIIEEVIIGSDVVISTLGPAHDLSRKIKGTPIADGHEIIINAMEKNKKKRFITLATPSIHSDDDGNNFCTIVPPIIAKIIFPNMYRDFKKIETHVKKSSLDWTVVRMIKPNFRHKDSEYRISLGDKPAKIFVSRENVGLFMYKVASENSYIRKMPIVFNK